MAADANVYSLSMEVNLLSGKTRDQLLSISKIFDDVEANAAQVGPNFTKSLQDEINVLQSSFGDKLADMYGDAAAQKTPSIPVDDMKQQVTQMAGALRLAKLRGDSEADLVVLRGQVHSLTEKIQGAMETEMAIANDRIAASGKLGREGLKANKNVREYADKLSKISDIDEELIDSDKERNKLAGERHDINQDILRALQKQQSTMQRGFGDALVKNLSGIVDRGLKVSAVYALVINPLKEVIEAQEMFSGALYRSMGNMQKITRDVGMYRAELGATSKEVTSTIQALAEAGIAADHMEQLTKSSVKFSRITGVANEQAGAFAGVMTKLTGSTAASTIAMAELSIAMEQGKITQQDVSAVMQGLTQNGAALNAIYGSGAIKGYARGLTKMAAAARAAGVDVSEASDLMNRLTNSAMDFVAVLGSEALFNSPGQNIESLSKKWGVMKARMDRIPPAMQPKIWKKFGFSPGQVAMMEKANGNLTEMKSEMEANKKLQEGYKKTQESWMRTLVQLQETFGGLVQALMSSFLPVLKLVGKALLIVALPFAMIIDIIKLLEKKSELAARILQGTLMVAILLFAGYWMGVVPKIVGGAKAISGAFSKMKTMFTGAAKVMDTTTESSKKMEKSVGKSGGISKGLTGLGVGLRNFFKSMKQLSLKGVLKFAAAMLILGATLLLLGYAFSFLPAATLISMGVALAGFGVLIFAASKFMGAAAPELSAFAVALLLIAGAIFIVAAGAALLIMAFTGLIEAVGGPEGLISLGLGMIMLGFGLVATAFGLAMLAPAILIGIPALVALAAASWATRSEFGRFAADAAPMGEALNSIAKGGMGLSGAAAGLYSLSDALSGVTGKNVKEFTLGIRSLLGAIWMMTWLQKPLAEFAGSVKVLSDAQKGLDLSFLDKLSSADYDTKKIREVANSIFQLAFAMHTLNMASTFARVFGLDTLDKLAAPKKTTQTIKHAFPPGEKKTREEQLSELKKIRQEMEKSNTHLGSMDKTAVERNEKLSSIVKLLKEGGGYASNTGHPGSYWG